MAATSMDRARLRVAALLGVLTWVPIPAAAQAAPPAAAAPAGPVAGGEDGPRVPLTLVPDRRSGRIALRIDDTYCVLPCTVEVRPGPHQVTVRGTGGIVGPFAFLGGSYFERKIEVPPVPVRMRVRHQRRGLLGGGLIFLGGALLLGGLGGYSLHQAYGPDPDARARRPQAIAITVGAGLLALASLPLVYLGAVERDEVVVE